MMFDPAVVIGSTQAVGVAGAALAARAVTLRRATLVDVPAVARRLTAPLDGWRRQAGLSADVVQGTLRLFLAHVGLERGLVWVDEGAEREVRSAALLLPAGLVVRDTGFDHVLQRELRLPRSTAPALLPVPQAETPDGGPDTHWVLVPDGFIAVPAAFHRAMRANGGNALALGAGPSLE